MASRKKFEEEPPTARTCLACGGDYEHRSDKGSAHSLIICRWCTKGRMSAAQLKVWKARRTRP